MVMVMAMNMNNNGGRAFRDVEADPNLGNECISKAELKSMARCRRSLDCFRRKHKGKYPMRDKFMEILVEELENYKLSSASDDDDAIIDCSGGVDVDQECKKMMPIWK